MLVLDDGTVLYDSHVMICFHLDGSAAAPRSTPRPASWDWQRRTTLGTALTEASVLWLFQKRQPADQQSVHLKSHYEKRMRRVTAALDAEAEALAAAPFRIDHIAVLLRHRPPGVPARRLVAGGLPGAHRVVRGHPEPGRASQRRSPLTEFPAGRKKEP